jgi:4'-phosphopantetheinyl transferase EntD
VIEELLPSTVIAVEARHDEDGELFAQERLALGAAVEKRRREFTTGRACARAALGRLGFPALAIPAGEKGEPLWPAGVVGSITHCEGYRACAVARSEHILTVGIDAEPNAPLPQGLLGDIAQPEEQPVLRQLRMRSPEVHWDRLLFSAKESVYKAWFPLQKRWLGFEDAVLELDRRAGSFQVRLLVSTGGSLRGFSGRWMARDGLLLTAIALPRPAQACRDEVTQSS